MRKAREDVGRHAGVVQRIANAIEPLAASAPMRLTFRPSSMICPTDMRGFSDENGSWKTICMRERSGFIRCREKSSMALPLKEDFAAVVRNQPKQRLAERRLAGAGFANKARAFRAAHGDVETVDRNELAEHGLQPAARLERKSDPHLAAFEDRRARRRRIAGTLPCGSESSSCVV